MAFRAPANHRQLSIQSLPPQDDDNQTEAALSPLLSSPGLHSLAVEQDVDEWVVFAPSSVGGATAVTGTNPLSRISEIGSVNSAPQVLRHGGDYGFSGTFEDFAGDEEDEEDEDDYLDGTETDSLQPFREQDNEGPVMLPTHDGLGMFPSSSGVISGLRSLEESLRIVAMAGHGQGEEDTDAKIQRWRLEHSKALLDEIEKVTRRRMSLASLRGGSLGQQDKNLLEEDTDFIGTSAGEYKSSASTTAESQTEGTMEESQELPETFWRRITRRFIRDIMGIDDELLQVIFGEALPAEVSTPFLNEENKVAKDAEERLLNRLARELGVLVHQYTSYPSGDGAFSTHRGSFAEYDDDDGIKTPQAQSFLSQKEDPSVSSRERQRSQSFGSSSTVPQFQFAPTLPQEEVSHAALWGIEEEQDIDEETQAKRDSQLRKEYWEQELGVRVFFSFLKSRFSGPASTPAPPVVPISPIHQHHPLIRNTRPAFLQHQSQVTKRSTPAVSAKVGPSSTIASTSGGQFFGTGFTFGMKSGSSYASAGKKTVSSRGSSRNRGFYWDVASSVGSGKTGSCIGTGVWAAI